MASVVEKYDVDTVVEKADVIELESGTMQKLKALSQKLGIEGRGIEVSGHPSAFVFIAICIWYSNIFSFSSSVCLMMLEQIDVFGIMVKFGLLPTVSCHPLVSVSLALVFSDWV
jgi:hypothetical protein